MTINKSSPSPRTFGYLLRRAYELGVEILLTGISTLILRLKCLLLGVHCGRRVHAFGRVILRAPGANVEIGDDVSFLSSSWRCSSSALAHPVRLRTFSPAARIVIGDGAGLNGTSITARSRQIFVGRGAMIGPDCLIMDSDFHTLWPPEARKVFDDTEDADVVIGDNVWLGARCIVMKGASVGRTPSWRQEAWFAG